LNDACKNYLMEMSPVAETELIERVQKGDVLAFEEIHRRFSHRIYGFIKKKLGTHSAEVDELYQETFLKLYLARMSIDPKQLLSPWIFTICRNVVTDQLRKNLSQSTGHHEFENHERTMSEAGHPQPDFQEIPLEQLTDEHREVIRLRMSEDHSFDEMAKILKIEPQTARQRLSRALRHLRTLMEVRQS
jgi:RNA polymerase sigma-70 factor (ECF subfamily)